MANNNSKRGFAAMDEDKRREIARKGGMHSHSGSKNGSSHATNQARSSGRGNQGERSRSS